jgi:hypothetical protein
MNGHQLVGCDVTPSVSLKAVIGVRSDVTRFPPAIARERNKTSSRSIMHGAHFTCVLNESGARIFTCSALLTFS